MNALQKEKYYTYSDYLMWDTETRYELIDGVPYMMSPAPLRKHQEISGEIFKQLAVLLTGKTCKVYHAPFDVRLDAANDDDTVVQPDIVVICDKSKLDDKGCKGVPDMIIEILSPSTASHDKVLKFNKYLKSGVREYWIVDPDSETVIVHILKDACYMTNAYANTDAVSVHVLEGCLINLQDVFNY